MATASPPASRLRPARRRSSGAQRGKRWLLSVPLAVDRRFVVFTAGPSSTACIWLHRLRHHQRTEWIGTANSRR